MGLSAFVLNLRRGFCAACIEKHCSLAVVPCWCESPVSLVKHTASRAPPLEVLIPVHQVATQELVFLTSKLLALTYQSGIHRILSVLCMGGSSLHFILPLFPIFNSGQQPSLGRSRHSFGHMFCSLFTRLLTEFRVPSFLKCVSSWTFISGRCL